MTRVMARIARTVPRGKRKPNLRRAAEHLEFVRALEVCMACGRRGRCQAMHIRNKTDGGVGLKPSDKFCVPGCLECHARQHRCGEITFWGEKGIDPLDAASRLWTVSGDLAAGRRIVFRALQSIALHKEGR